MCPNLFSRSRGIPYLDMGSGFAVDEGSGVLESGGQVLICRPAGACVLCLGFRDSLEKYNYFLPGSMTPEPSSVAINAVVATLGLECLLGLLGIERVLQPVTLRSKTSFDFFI